MTWVIWTKPNCMTCRKTLTTLERTGETVIEHKTETVLERGAAFTAGFKTFPQVFRNGKHIGGLGDVLHHLTGADKTTVYRSV
jgi:glutaredoxin